MLFTLRRRGGYLVVGYFNGLAIIDLNKFEIVKKFKNMHKENARCVLFTPNSRYLIVADEGINFIDFQERIIVKEF